MKKIDSTPDDEQLVPHDEHKTTKSKEESCRLKLIISYDGTDFSGWQRQTHSPSIQGALESALTRFYRQPIHLLGASRTDAGVHARGQVGHFDAPRDPRLSGDLRYALNAMTPPSIVVRKIFLAPPRFHAIADAVGKTYTYIILNRRVPSALRCRYSYWVRYPLNVDYLNAASQYLIGEHDFKSFQTSGTRVKSTIRRIESIQWKSNPEEQTVEFSVTGNGFLKQMVRNIVGTLIDMNQNQMPSERMKQILEARDRRQAGPSAPPQGLFLDRVFYPNSLDKDCREI